VHEPDIAPLARRLAEENNVDWRRLHGSGDGGRIVERDVLTFLAKVMAGEEDLDPTPEPVPEGMQAWPDADVAAYHATAAAPPIERSVTATLDDDLFLFDDAPGAAPPEARIDASAPEGHGAPPAAFDGRDAPATADEDDGLLLVDEAEEGDAGAWDDGATDAAPLDAAATSDGEDDDGVFEFGDADPPPPRPTVDAGALPDLFENGSAATAAADDALFLDGPVDPIEVEPTARIDSAVLDLDDRRAAGDRGQTAPPGTALRRADDDTHAAPGGGLDFVIEEETAAVAAVAAVPRHALESADVAVVRHGQVWRRRVDDRPFRHAVSQLADVLGAPPSAVAVALLARAVRRVWPGVQAVDGWWWGEDGSVRRKVDTDGRIGDAVAALAAADGDAAGTAPLVVADLSGIALDEAVLHLEAPVLALGRATGDGAWLTLSGDDVPREAVAALGSVAEALAAPIRLVV
jgi:hypothetical protein